MQLVSGLAFLVKHSPEYRLSQLTSASVSGFRIVAVSLEVGRGLF